MPSPNQTSLHSRLLSLATHYWHHKPSSTPQVTRTSFMVKCSPFSVVNHPELMADPSFCSRWRARCILAFCLWRLGRQVTTPPDDIQPHRNGVFTVFHLVSHPEHPCQTGTASCPTRCWTYPAPPLHNRLVCLILDMHGVTEPLPGHPASSSHYIADSFGARRLVLGMFATSHTSRPD